MATWAAIAASRDSLLEARTVEAALEKSCDRRDLLVLETEGWPRLTKGLFFVTAPPVNLQLLGPFSKRSKVIE